MKLFSAAIVVMLVCAVTIKAVEDSSVTDSNDLRNLMECTDGVFVELVKEHKEIEKFYYMFKAYANVTSLRLGGCDNAENPEIKKECVNNAFMMFSMVYISDIIQKLEEENKELADKLMDLLEHKCT